MVASVEDDSIASHQAAHHRGDRRGAGLQQQVEVVRDKCPGETASRGLFEDMAETRDKMVAIGVIDKDLSPLQPSAEDVVASARSVYASFDVDGTMFHLLLSTARAVAIVSTSLPSNLRVSLSSISKEGLLRSSLKTTGTVNCAELGAVA